MRCISAIETKAQPVDIRIEKALDPLLLEQEGANRWVSFDLRNEARKSLPFVYSARSIETGQAVVDDRQHHAVDQVLDKGHEWLHRAQLYSEQTGTCQR